MLSNKLKKVAVAFSVLLTAFLLFVGAKASAAIALQGSWDAPAYAVSYQNIGFKSEMTGLAPSTTYTLSYSYSTGQNVSYTFLSSSTGTATIDSNGLIGNLSNATSVSVNVSLANAAGIGVYGGGAGESVTSLTLGLLLSWDAPAYAVVNQNIGLKSSLYGLVPLHTYTIKYVYNTGQVVTYTAQSSSSGTLSFDSAGLVADLTTYSLLHADISVYDTATGTGICGGGAGESVTH